MEVWKNMTPGQLELVGSQSIIVHLALEKSGFRPRYLCLSWGKQWHIRGFGDIGILVLVLYCCDKHHNQGNLFKKGLF